MRLSERCQQAHSNLCPIHSNSTLRSSCRITERNVYLGLSLLSSLSELVGQIDYAKLILKDSSSILQNISGDSTVTSKVTRSQALVFTLSRLGDVSAQQNDLEAVFAFYGGGAGIDTSMTPLYVQDGISAILLATGKVELFFAR